MDSPRIAWTTTIVRVSATIRPKITVPTASAVLVVPSPWRLTTNGSVACADCIRALWALSPEVTSTLTDSSSFRLCPAASGAVSGRPYG